VQRPKINVRVEAIGLTDWVRPVLYSGSGHCVFDHNSLGSIHRSLVNLQMLDRVKFGLYFCLSYYIFDYNQFGM
jgi:hypothetical protein